jgi:hypothetical protein
MATAVRESDSSGIPGICVVLGKKKEKVDILLLLLLLLLLQVMMM